MQVDKGSRILITPLQDIITTEFSHHQIIATYNEKVVDLHCREQPLTTLCNITKLWTENR